MSALFSLSKSGKGGWKNIDYPPPLDSTPCYTLNLKFWDSSLNCRGKYFSPFRCCLFPFGIPALIALVSTSCHSDVAYFLLGIPALIALVSTSCHSYVAYFQSVLIINSLGSDCLTINDCREKDRGTYGGLAQNKRRGELPQIKM